MKNPILIAHRGLFNGPDQNLENHPDQIDQALCRGFDCEVDLWCINDKLFLGHDQPQYEINFDYLKDRSEKLWIHAKNLSALYYLLSTNQHYFWHQEDDYVLTNKCYIWTYPGKPLTGQSVCVMPEWNDPDFLNLDLTCFGICSDYVKN